MNSLLFDNLLSWSAQASILAIAAGGAAYALRHSRARLYFWQAILAVVVVLPAIAPGSSGGIVLPPPAPIRGLVANGVAVPITVSMSWGVGQLLALLAAGAALRMLWVGVGLLRLARIRKHARPMQHPPVAFGGSARWYVSDQVSGPVTFGWLRPSILLPARVCELPPSAQEAIASHELFHVHRRDWLFVMAEELIRSLLWFHPAVWFVLSRVQLAREQVVDQEVVDATRDRAGYLDALVSVAAQRLQPDVAPATLFLKKRQLAVRVQALLKETSMSASRLAAHVSVAASVAILGACAAVWFFPLRSAAQVVAGRSRHYSRRRRDAGASLAGAQSARHRHRRRRAAGAHAEFQRRGRRCARAERSGRIAQGRAGERAGLALRGGYRPALGRTRDDSLRETDRFGSSRRTRRHHLPPPPPPPSAAVGGRWTRRQRHSALPPPPPPATSTWRLQWSANRVFRPEPRITAADPESLDGSGGRYASSSEKLSRLGLSCCEIDEHLTLGNATVGSNDLRSART